MKVVTFILGSLLSLTAVYAAEDDPVYFYQGKPIATHVFAEFVPWSSDTNSSPTVTIDLAQAANARNEYDKDNIKRDDFLGEHGFCSERDRVEGRYAGEVCYWWHGKLSNGLHLFTVTDNGGGRMTTENQFLIRFHKGREVDLETGEVTDRDLMTLMGTYGVYGDRSRLRVESGELSF